VTHASTLPANQKQSICFLHEPHSRACSFGLFTIASFAHRTGLVYRLGCSNAPESSPEMRL
jgi:hypothetical protein